jgi:hypothetical protein
VPDGLFFCRLASNIGMESRVRHLQGRRFLLPDSSERYLVDEAMLLAAANELEADLLDPGPDRAESTPWPWAAERCVR